jgi:hypothetical protein
VACAVCTRVLLPNHHRVHPATTQIVRDDRLWTVGDYICNVFDAGRDVHTYMSPDRINALAVTPCLPGGPPGFDQADDAVLGCQDRYVRVLRGDSCIVEAGLEGPVTAVAIVPPATTGGNRELRHIIYGTSNGVIGLLLATADSLTPCWTITPSTAAGVAPAAVNCLEVCDLSGFGTHGGELILGRDDGTLEVYALDCTVPPRQGGRAPPMSPPAPRLVLTVGLQESIRSVACGHVSHASFAEILVLTYR